MSDTRGREFVGIKMRTQETLKVTADLLTFSPPSKGSAQSCLTCTDILTPCSDLSPSRSLCALHAMAAPYLHYHFSIETSCSITPPLGPTPTIVALLDSASASGG